MIFSSAIYEFLKKNVNMSEKHQLANHFDAFLRI